MLDSLDYLAIIKQLNSYIAAAATIITSTSTGTKTIAAATKTIAAAKTYKTPNLNERIPL